MKNDMIEGTVETLSKTTPNGLILVRVQYGLARMPEGPDEVRVSFTEAAALLREFADGIENVNAKATQDGR